MNKFNLYLSLWTLLIFPLVSETSIPDKNNLQLRMKAERMLIEGEGQRHATPSDDKSSILEMQCPICNTGFRAINTENQLADRGIDRDFCRHSQDKSTYDFNIWTCPSCGYSNHKSFFSYGPSQALSEDEKADLKGRLIALFTETMGVNISRLGYLVDQEDIPTSIKFQLMLTLLPKLNLPWKVKADFYLTYAWSERLRFCAPIVSPALSTSISSIHDRLRLYEKQNNIENIITKPKDVLFFLDMLAKERKNDLSSIFILKIYQAEQMDRLGFAAQASAIIKEAILLDVHPTWRNIANFKYKVLENEQLLLKEAIIAIKETMRHDEYELSEWSSSIYLVGELQRRIGLFSEADAWLQAAQESCSEPLKTWAKEQREKIPQSAIGILSDSEKILIHKAQKILEMVEKEQHSSFAPEDLSKDKAKRWLEAIQIAAINYHRQYKIDPESITELYELGLLKGQPDLPKEGLRFFNLQVDPKNFVSSLRFTIECILPFSDEQGYYLWSYSKGKLIRTSPQQ